MGRIQKLPDEVASQVAAGEVVERPASIVKELMENSIDAESSRIDVEYQRGGSRFLAITDNGRGMDRDDAVLCLERHATSKIRSGLDLETVRTFGFRGEALPSIASVSQFRLCTREHDAAAGTEVVVRGGKIESVGDAGEAPGTRIEVRNLFFNLPARKKFLRGERTEAAHIDHTFQTLALAHPGLRFSLTRDGRQAHLLGAAPTLEDRVRDLFGVEFLSAMFRLKPLERQGIRLHGLLGRPGNARGDRTAQTVFVNGRPVVSGSISQPLRDAYGSALPRGMHPAAILFLEIDPSHVDCNVHPAKREVRFRDGITVREVVHEIVRGALEAFRTNLIARPASVPAPAIRPAADPADTDAPSERTTFLTPAQRQPHQPKTESIAAEISPQEGETAFPAAVQFVTPRPAAPVAVDLPGAAPPNLDAFRFLGVAAGRFAVLEERGVGLVLLDHRAAHERIVFEALLRQIASRTAESQRLLLPVVVEVAPRDFQWITENRDLLASAGLLVDAFGNRAVKIDGVPPALAGSPAPDLLLRIADDCRLSGKSGRTTALEQAVARSVARSAVPPDPPRNAAEADQLLAALLACDLPYACPNGKATMTQFGFPEIERRFGGR